MTAAPQGRRVVLTPASHIKIARASWLWDTSTSPDPRNAEGRIPIGGVTIAAGRAGIGKSQWTTWVVAMVTRGALPGEFYGTPRSVVIAAAEDSWSMTIAPRLIAAGADLDRVFRADVSDDGDQHARLTLPTDLRSLTQLLTEHDVGVVICDPLLSMLSSVNDYRAVEVRTAMEPLARMAEKARCAVIGLAHFNKAAGSDPLLAISGSGAFGQVIRAAIGFARDESDDEHPVSVLSTVKSNLGREDLPNLTYTIEPVEVQTDEGPAWVSRFVLGEGTHRSVRDVMRDSAGPDEAHDERREAVAWLSDFIDDHGGECSARDAIKAAALVGISQSTLTRARKPAGVISSKGGMSGGWVWTRQAAPKKPEEAEEPTYVGVSSSVSSVTSSGLPCAGCGGPMDPAVAAEGRHPNCWPGDPTRCATHPARRLAPNGKCVDCMAEQRGWPVTA